MRSRSPVYPLPQGAFSVHIYIYIFIYMKKQQFCSLRTQQHMMILKSQYAETSNYYYSSECYISLVASLLDQQNTQFNNIKEGNFRSLKDCMINKYVIMMAISYYSEEDAGRTKIILQLNIQKNVKNWDLFYFEKPFFNWPVILFKI